MNKKATRVMTVKGRLSYASKRRNDKKQNEAYRNTFGDWADFTPRRDYGIYANVMTTYKHNGETKWT